MAESSAARAVLRARMDDMLASACELRAVLEELEGTASVVAEGLDSGASLLELYGSVGFSAVRDRVYAASSAFEAQFQSARAAGIWLLVEEGLSISEVARLMGRSRQFVSRLYHLVTPPS